MIANATRPLLQVKDLSVDYLTDRGPVRAVDRVSLDGHQREEARADRPADAEPAAGVGVVATPSLPLAGPESLPQLTFAVAGASALRYAAAPTVALEIEIESDLAVRSLALNAQIRIVPTKRSYDLDDEERLLELFGTRERWGDTLRGFLWTNTSLVVPAFTGRTDVELPVACTYDLDVAAAKYLRALRDGEVPIELLFSGTVFYLGDGGLLRTAQIPWRA